jgi:hypothetical protein
LANNFQDSDRSGCSVMTASELIRLLQEFPPDIKIVVRGYEDGYNDILKLRQVKIKYNPEAARYYGLYFDSEEANAILAVDLFGKNPNEK